MTKHINIDEILETVEDYPTTGNGKVIHRIDYKLLKQQLKDLILEIIGADNTEVRGTNQNPDNPMYWTKKTTYRNGLKAEQRQKLTDLFDIKENPTCPICKFIFTHKVGMEYCTCEESAVDYNSGSDIDIKYARYIGAVGVEQQPNNDKDK